MAAPVARIGAASSSARNRATFPLRSLEGGPLVQDFSGPLFRTDDGRLIDPGWTRLRPCAETDIQLPPPPGSKIIDPAAVAARGLRVREREFGSGVDRRRTRTLRDPGGRPISHAEADAPWKAGHFDALHDAVRLVLQTHAFPVDVDATQELLSGWTGAHLIWTPSPPFSGTVDSDEWEFCDLHFGIYGLQGADGANLWLTDSPFFWAHSLWPLISSLRATEANLIAQGVDARIVEELRQASFDIGAIATRHTFRGRHKGDVIQAERSRATLEKATQNSAENNARHKALWSKAFANFMQPVIDQEVKRLGRHISRDEAAELAVTYWPKEGFRGLPDRPREMICPKRATLIKTLADLESGTGRETPLLVRERPPTGRPRRRKTE